MPAAVALCCVSRPCSECQGVDHEHVDPAEALGSLADGGSPQVVSSIATLQRSLGPDTTEVGFQCSVGNQTGEETQSWKNR
jgi:hypothetical protein